MTYPDRPNWVLHKRGSRTKNHEPSDPGVEDKGPEYDEAFLVVGYLGLYGDGGEAHL